IALCGALSYGELGAAMPGAGGEYLFLSELYHPLFGFLSGWMMRWISFMTEEQKLEHPGSSSWRISIPYRAF
ncbi:MAG TPA: amino acid permease, partial [Bacteroidales bacterium]|nr:amino acid permease [Bacteroidales bacterium]